jgi:ribosomal protein S27AE
VTGNWVRTYENGLEYIESLGGVAWNDSEPPWSLHRCRPQTRGWMNANSVERCRCGATRLDGNSPWLERNQTRQHRKRRRQEDRLPRVTVTCQDCGKPYEAAGGTPVAREEMCSNCWATRFLASRAQRQS